MSDQVGREVGGYLVISITTPEGASPVPQWAFRHFTTRDDALEAAREFTEQAEGNEAFVLAAEAHCFSPSRQRL